jgi:hypothetical protein
LNQRYRGIVHEDVIALLRAVAINRQCLMPGRGESSD